MALVESNLFGLGILAPDCSLLNVSTGKQNNLNDLRGDNGTVILFICNHCPFVLHVNEGIVELANDYQRKGINFIAISSNDVDNYPQDGPEQMKAVAQKLAYPFPYLYDETQEVAKAYNAACTPDFYVFDPELRAVYHGQLDDSRPGNGKPVTGDDMRIAFEALLSFTENKALQKPSIGCSIKWK
ncbi:MAG: redoxin domain-containing protein [Crocinitomix sp.]|nr:redoxin domain-containing protein [Crocinitomix sp.]